jgi:hypothetical protein
VRKKRLSTLELLSFVRHKEDSGFYSRCYREEVMGSEQHGDFLFCHKIGPFGCCVEFGWGRQEATGRKNNVSPSAVNVMPRT